MNPEDSRQQTLELVALGEIDSRRNDAQRLIDSVPRVLAARQRDSKDSEVMVEAAHQKLKGFQAHLKTLELDLASREESLGKANANLLTAKSNQEYSLLMAEIGRRKEEKGAVEEAILEQYDVIRQGERMVADAKARLAEAQAEFGEFEKRAFEQHQEHQEDLAKLEAERDAVRERIDGAALKLYDRALKAHGNAIVPAEAKTCQGCFSSLTPNDSNRLLSGRQVVLCRVCQRILYMPEALQTSPT